MRAKGKPWEPAMRAKGKPWEPAMRAKKGPLEVALVDFTRKTIARMAGSYIIEA